MIKNGHPVTLYRESGITPPEGEDWDSEYDGHRFDELSLEDQAAVKKWFFDNFESASTYGTKAPSSYGLKHMAECIVSTGYVSNDQMKDALLSWGFKPKNPHECNWTFKIKFRRNAIKRY